LHKDNKRKSLILEALPRTLKKFCDSFDMGEICCSSTVPNEIKESVLSFKNKLN